MSAIAWQKLGLQPDFITGELAPDVDHARVAIGVAAKPFAQSHFTTEIVVPQYERFYYRQLQLS